MGLEEIAGLLLLLQGNPALKKGREGKRTRQGWDNITKTGSLS